VAVDVVRGSAAGHPDIRATHAKTLELVREDEIGARATCVVGVAARLDEQALLGLRGRVEVIVECGGFAGSVRGRVNPAWRVGDPLVVRRAPFATRDALVIDADGGASGLERGLVACLARAGADIGIAIKGGIGAGPGALYVSTDDSFEDYGGYSPAEAQINPDLVLRSPLADDDIAAGLAALDAGERVALRLGAEADANAGALLDAAHAEGHDILPARGAGVEAVAGVEAAARVDARVLRPRDHDWDSAGGVVLEGVPVERIDKWLRRATREGARRGAVGLDLGTPRERFVSWRPGERVEVPGARGRRATLALQLGGRTASTSSVSRPEPRTSR
jgi:hypothetical protein